MRRNAIAWSGIVFTILIVIVFQVTTTAFGTTNSGDQNQDQPGTTEGSASAPRKFTTQSPRALNPITNSTYNSRYANPAQLTAATEDAQQSSRRRSPLQATAVPVVAPDQGQVNTEEKISLPTSLDDALSRLKDYPIKTKEEPKPATPPAASQATPKPATKAPSRFSAAPSTGTPNAAKPTEQPKAIQRPSSLGNTPKPSPQANAPISLQETPAAQPSTATAAGSRFSGTPATTPSKQAVSPPISIQKPQTVVQPTPTASGPVKTPISTTAKNLFALQSPNIAVNTVGPKAIVIGKEATYNISAKNLGAIDARSLAVQIRLPQGVRLLGQNASTGSAKVAPIGATQGMLRWEIPVLPARNEATIQLRLMPLAGQKFDLGVDVIYSATSNSHSIVILEPKLEMKIEGDNDVLFGDTKMYRIILSNPGTGTAENVGLTLMPIKQGQQPTTFDQIGNIHPGANKVIEVELTAKQAGQLLIQANAFADGNLQSTASQQVLARRANLQLTAQGPRVKYAATEATYLFNVNNIGNASAKQVAAEVTLPLGAQFVSCTAQGVFDKTTNRVTWNLSQLDANTTKALQLNCVLTADGNNSITAKSSSAGGLLATKSLTTLVESIADLKLYVNDPKGPVPVGEEVVYEFRLENRGTKVAENISIAVTFAEGIQPLAAVGAQSKIQTGVVNFNSIPRLEAGKEMVLKVTAKALAAGSHSFRVEVKCNDPVTKLASEETTRFYATGTPSGTVPSQARRLKEPSPLLPLPYRGIR
ncbi:MAG: hypothetical protein ACKVH8_10745 [Pirellulales bacterium]